MISVDRHYLPGYSFSLPEGKGKSDGKNYCPNCSQGRYETKVKWHYIFGIIPIRTECDVYHGGEHTEHFRYKNASYCGKCKNLNGYYLNRGRKSVVKATLIKERKRQEKMVELKTLKDIPKLRPFKTKEGLGMTMLNVPYSDEGMVLDANYIYLPDLKKEAIKRIKDWKKQQEESGCAKMQNKKNDPQVKDWYMLKEGIHCGTGICIQCDENQHEDCSWYIYPEIKIELFKDFFNITNEDL